MTDSELLAYLQEHQDSTELDLSRKEISTLPPELGRLTHLQKLGLNSNQLTSLPSEIGRLTNLQKLDLWNNKLTTLPPETARLTNLQTLDLRFNQLTSLPPETARLTNLQTLDLEGNQLTSLPPEIGRLTNLQALRLGGNQLTSLPPEIVGLINLQVFSISQNRLTSLPPELVRLTNLQKLNLRSNRLTSLPPEIVQLTRLQALYLARNQLTSLPPEIDNLEQLMKLDLQGNPLTIPPEILAKVDYPKAIIAWYLANVLSAAAKRPLNEAKTNTNREPSILRSIEFSPEHYEAGMTILSYFGKILMQKYPEMKVRVRIEQEGLKVRMIIQPGEGNIEIVEKTLEEYSLVIFGELPPEQYFSNPFEVLALKNQLKIAHLQYENQRDLLKIADTSYNQRISALEDEVTWLRSLATNIMMPEKERRKRKMAENKGRKGGEGYVINIEKVDQSVITVGPKAQVHDINIQQIWNQYNPDIQELAKLLPILKAEMEKKAETPERDRAIPLVDAAIKAAQNGDGPKALSFLQKAGKFVYEVAQHVPAICAAEVIWKVIKQLCS